MTFEDGEGAVSSGPMIVVHGARTEKDARDIVALLESHTILAITDTDVRGLLVPQSSDAISVLVPMSMVMAARAVLASHVPSGRVRISAPPMSSPPRFTVPPSMTGTAFGIDEDEDDDDDDDEDEDDEYGPGPLEFELPVPVPLNGRLSAALAAIVGGAGVQRWLEGLWGPGVVRANLAARWDQLLVEPWRLVTAGFIHGGPSHYISNGLFGLMIGVVLFGTHRVGATTLVWLFSSAVGLGAEALMSQDAWIVGASAGNYGLVGLWAHGQFERSRVATLPRRERLRTIGVLLLLVPGAFTPFSSTGTRIAVMAHAAGFVGGFIAGYPFSRRLLPEGFGRIEARSRVAAIIASIVVVVAAGMATWTYR